MLVHSAEWTTRCSNVFLHRGLLKMQLRQGNHVIRGAQVSTNLRGVTRHHEWRSYTLLSYKSDKVDQAKNGQMNSRIWRCRFSLWQSYPASNNFKVFLFISNNLISLHISWSFLFQKNILKWTQYLLVFWELISALLILFCETHEH